MLYLSSFSFPSPHKHHFIPLSSFLILHWCSILLHPFPSLSPCISKVTSHVRSCTPQTTTCNKKQSFMGSPSELSLDYKPTSYSAMQKQQGGQPAAEQTQKIHEFLARLEEERFKIEAFKRELPLCMQLLNNAVEAYRQQLEAYQTSQGPLPVLEEFIPLKNVDGSDKPETNAPSEKASWMISAQLWSPANDAAKQSPGTPVTPPGKDVADHGFDVVVSSKLALDAKQRNGGAFLPFSKEKNKGNVAGKGLPEAAAIGSSPDRVVGEKKCMEVIESNDSKGRRENGTMKGGAGAEQGGKGGGGGQSDQCQAQAPQPHRKARRCWSPDLHRRFVNALQILGGSQVATPKQIRELMKVDGLTNDEVKSHLQKYRLHTRRPIPAPPAPAAGAAPQLVVLGGIWVPPEYAASAAGPAAIYGAHPSPAHYCTAMPQEYYPPPLQAHHHHIHRPTLHRSALAPGLAYKGRASSPDQSEGRSGAEQSESIEEDEQREGEERDDEEETEEDEEDGEAANKTKAAAGDEKALVPLAAKADDGGLKF